MLTTVRADGAAKAGKPVPQQELDAYFSTIKNKYDTESEAYYATARLWDDGIIEPTQTRHVLSLALAAAANAPIPETKAGVFRM